MILQRYKPLPYTIAPARGQTRLRGDSGFRFVRVHHFTR
jgi:hypothetical protein